MVGKYWWLPSGKSSVQIKAAWVAGVLALIGIVVTSLFNYKPGNTLHQGQMLFNPAGSTTINNYYPNDNATAEAIREFQKRLNGSDNKIELTRKEIELLSGALKDLDERTSAIKKLPDGTTQFGNIIAGEPKIVVENYNLAVKAFFAKDYVSSLKYAEQAANAYEKSQGVNHGIGIVVGGTNPKFVGMIYRLAGISAQQNGYNNLSSDYAKAAVKADPSSAENHGLYASALFNLSRYQEASEEIQRALTITPGNAETLKWKQIIDSKIQKP